MPKIEGVVEVGKAVDVMIEYANTGHEPGQNLTYAVNGFTETEDDERDGTA